MCFHNGYPVELLFRLEQTGFGERWQVHPLMVEAPDRPEWFRRSEHLRPLHVKFR